MESDTKMGTVAWGNTQKPESDDVELTDREYATYLAKEHAPLTFFKMALAVLAGNLMTALVAGVLYAMIK